MDKKPEQFLATYVKGRIEQNLHSIFGEIGGHTTIDLIKFDQNNRRFILRVPERDYVKLRATLTLSSVYQSISCCFRVNSVSPVLLTLLASGDNNNSIEF